MSYTIYAGPGKIKRGSMSLHAEGAAGRITAKRNDEMVPSVSSFFGTVNKLIRDLTVEIDVTPYNDWSQLPYLYPLAVVGTGSAGATPGKLQVGGNPFDCAGTLGAPTGADVPVAIWTPMGRSYPFFRSAVTGHPEIHLGIDKAFYGAAKISVLGVLTKSREDAAFIEDTIQETGATDPDAATFASANVVNGEWTGVYGSVNGLTQIEAEDEWVITPTISYNTYKAQGLSRMMTLANVGFAVHCRPLAGTHTLLATALAGLKLGQQLNGTSLTLTSPTNSGRSIVLPNCQVTMGGYGFGGSQMGTEEIVFHNCQVITAGVPAPLLQFIGA